LRVPFGLVAFVALLVAGSAMAAGPPAYIVVDADSGVVLDHREADQLWYPASLSKLMTAYVTFKAIEDGRMKMTSPVKVSSNALSQAPSKMGFPVGTVMNLDNALKMMLVKSANDIAVAVAETVGGSESQFVRMMNAEARRLGMTSTHYNNPNGLPDNGQVTTARDLAVLARALWNDFPDRRSYLGIPAIKSGKHTLTSANTLLEHYRGTNGMKTGYICASGFNMIVSATRFGRTLIVVVLGETTSSDRAELAAGLLNEGFRKRFFGGGARPVLASFEAGRARGAPVNMRDYGVCTKKAQAEGDASDDGGDRPGPRSALGPRFVLMEPVRVYTGRADPKLPMRVPLPHLAPYHFGDNATLPSGAAGKALQ
jgi:D-alanyl-D-alanine carboxypeptidase